MKLKPVLLADTLVLFAVSAAATFAAEEPPAKTGQAEEAGAEKLVGKGSPI